MRTTIHNENILEFNKALGVQRWFFVEVCNSIAHFLGMTIPDLILSTMVSCYVDYFLILRIFSILSTFSLTCLYNINMVATFNNSTSISSLNHWKKIHGI